MGEGDEFSGVGFEKIFLRVGEKRGCLCRDADVAGFEPAIVGKELARSLGDLKSP